MYQTDQETNRETSIAKGLLAGAIAGAIASIAMNGFQSLVKSITDDKTDSEKPEQDAQKLKGKQPEEQSEPATIKAAKRISSDLFDHALQKSEKEPAGQAMHFAMGIGSAMIYGAAAEYSELVSAAAGTAFGATVWVLADEVAVPALGLSKAPDEYPIAVHAKALTAHLFYGIVTELTRRGVRAML